MRQLRMKKLWQHRGNRNVHEILYSYSMYKAFIWSHDHHYGQCELLYLATNVYSTKKKKNGNTCTCAAPSSMRVYIVTKVISFSFFSLHWTVFIHQNKNTLQANFASVQYMSVAWLQLFNNGASYNTTHTTWQRRRGLEGTLWLYHLQQVYDNHKAMW